MTEATLHDLFRFGFINNVRYQAEITRLGCVPKVFEDEVDEVSSPVGKTEALQSDVFSEVAPPEETLTQAKDLTSSEIFNLVPGHERKKEKVKKKKQKKK